MYENRASCDCCAPVISLLLLRTAGSVAMLCSCSVGYTYIPSQEITVGVSHAMVRSRSPFPFPISLAGESASCVWHGSTAYYCTTPAN